MGSVMPDSNEVLPWQDVVAAKRLRRTEAIREFPPRAENASDLFGADSVAIAAGDIIARLHRQELSCKKLVTWYLQRTSMVHDKTNCLTEVCFQDALASAKLLDDHVRLQGELRGPLHGVPTTLKDQFNIKGYDTTLGYVGMANNPAEGDAALVEMLRTLGVVIMAKTNLPQSIMWCETDNPLWGLTTNPYDSRYTPGGSTGGEAVLIACGASILGFGTDIGGSVRIPSHMMGIYGLKPSSSRLPYEGVRVSTEGQEHVPSSVGPMASTLDTIHLSMKSLVDLKPWKYDSRCTPIPWREDVYQEACSRPLVFAVLYDDGVARPHPPVARVLQKTVSTLKSAGHEVIKWNADLHKDCVQVLDEYYTADGGEDIRIAVEAGGEPFIPHVAKLISRGPPISVFEYWQLNRRKVALQNAYLQKWNSMRTEDGRAVDAIIMPPMPHTAVPHENCRWVGYTKVWNVLDYSALVIPGGKVMEEDLDAPWDFDPRGEIDEWSLELWKKERDNMARLKLPVGVQIVCQKLEEEKIMGIGKVVDDLLRSARI